LLALGGGRLRLGRSRILLRAGCRRQGEGG